MAINLIALVWVSSELLLSAVKRARAGASVEDRHSLRLLWSVNTLATTAGVFCALGWSAGRLPGWFPFTLLGSLVFVAGTSLRWYAIYYLGRFFTVNVAIAADHQLIRTGPYRWVRHPSYTGCLMMVLGFALALGNALSVLVIMVPTAAVLLHRMNIEEDVLKQAFGEQYLAYTRQTRRLIPGLY